MKDGLIKGRAKDAGMKAKQLKETLLQSLRLQGFSIAADGRIVAIDGRDKDAIRRLHTAAREHL